MTPADELRAAVEGLEAFPSNVYGIVQTLEPDAVSPLHQVVVCDEDHATARNVREGCCQDCDYIGSYDPKLAALVANLLRAVQPLWAWLESLDGIEFREDAALADELNFALRFARAINGSQP